MAGHHNQGGCSMYNCIDVGLEQIPDHNLYPIIVGSSSDALLYDSGYAKSCVVCSK